MGSVVYAQRQRMSFHIALLRMAKFTSWRRWAHQGTM